MDEQSDRTRLIGVWSLVSIRDRLPDGAVGDHPDFGSDPAGHLVYTASGHVSVNFMRRSRLPWKSEESPTDSERAIAAVGYGAYAGRYTLHPEEGFVLHHVQVALNPNRVGRDLKRFVSISEDLLTLRPPPLVRAGKTVERSLVWRRIG
jgi:hypothetical protein